MFEVVVIIIFGTTGAVSASQDSSEGCAGSLIGMFLFLLAGVYICNIPFWIADRLFNTNVYFVADMYDIMGDDSSQGGGNTPEQPNPSNAPTFICSQGNSNVRLRSAPSTSSDIVTRLPAGAGISIIGYATGEEVTSGNNQWVQINYSGWTGYVYSRLVCYQ